MSTATAPDGASPLPLAVFADLDGTLIEIAETPQGVTVPEDLIAELKDVSAALGDALAVVSGREIADLDRLLDPLVLPIAGSHGAHRRGLGGTTDELPDAIIEASQKIADQLAPLVAADPRLLLEHKRGAVALHYRRAPGREEDCRAVMKAATEDFPGFNLLEGRMVFELRPAGIDKGAAVRAFMKEAPFAGRIPLFIGDDTTDEDGFRAVQELGGIGIKIGPGETVARGRLPDVDAARAFMRRVATGEPFTPAAGAQT